MHKQGKRARPDETAEAEERWETFEHISIIPFAGNQARAGTPLLPTEHRLLSTKTFAIQHSPAHQQTPGNTPQTPHLEQFTKLQQSNRQMISEQLAQAEDLKSDRLPKDLTKHLEIKTESIRSKESRAVHAIATRQPPSTHPTDVQEAPNKPRKAPGLIKSLLRSEEKYKALPR